MSSKPPVFYETLNRGLKNTKDIGQELKNIDINRWGYISENGKTIRYNNYPHSRKDLLHWFKVPRKRRRIWWREVCQEYRKDNGEIAEQEIVSLKSTVDENSDIILTKEDITREIAKYHQELISMEILIKSIILCYGKQDNGNHFYLEEEKIDSILITLLTEEGMDMAYFVGSLKNDGDNRLNFEYNPLDGNSYIKIPDNA